MIVAAIVWCEFFFSTQCRKNKFFFPLLKKHSCKKNELRTQNIKFHTIFSFTPEKISRKSIFLVRHYECEKLLQLFVFNLVGLQTISSSVFFFFLR